MSDKNCGDCRKRYICVNLDCGKCIEWTPDYATLLKENEELKKQIDKMKCCGNCLNAAIRGHICTDDLEMQDCFTTKKYWKLKN